MQHRAIAVQPSNRRWFVSSRIESDVSGYRSDHLRRVWERGQMVAGCSFGLTAPLAFLTDVTLYHEIGDVLGNCNTNIAIGETKNCIESLTLWRQISMFGCRDVYSGTAICAHRRCDRPALVAVVIVWCVDRFTR